MNNWFKLALYAFIGIVLSSFLVGIIAPSGGQMGAQYAPGYVNSGMSINQSQMPMNNNMMTTQSGMMNGGMMNGMMGGMGMSQGQGMQGGMSDM